MSEYEHWPVFAAQVRALKCTNKAGQAGLEMPELRERRIPVAHVKDNEVWESAISAKVSGRVMACGRQSRPAAGDRSRKLVPLEPLYGYVAPCDLVVIPNAVDLRCDLIMVLAPANRPANQKPAGISIGGTTAHASSMIGRAGLSLLSSHIGYEIHETIYCYIYN
jgi:hypothetical protein